MALTPEQVKTYVDSFSWYETTGLDVKRKFLAHYVDVGTNSTEKWELLGYKVEDASIEFNWNEETVTDITGKTYRTITKSEPSITLDGYIMNTKSTFLKTLSNMAIRNAYEEFGNFTVLTVYYWLTKGESLSLEYLAKKEKNCSIAPSSLGGEGYVRISPTITLSNDATFGSVTTGIGTEPTFTEGSI